MTQTMMREASISFPMLGNLTLDPKAYFTVFGHSIYWYGVILASAFLVGMLYCAHNAKRFGLVPDDIYEEMLWLIPLGIIGCRIYYVIFEWGYYSHHLNEIWRIRDGGIAMYGGIIAGIIFILIWTRRKNPSRRSAGPERTRPYHRPVHRPLGQLHEPRGFRCPNRHILPYGTDKPRRGDRLCTSHFSI